MLFLSLAALVILVRFKLELGWALLAASVLLGLSCGLSPVDLGRVFVASWIDPTTLELVASLLAILCLENVLRKRGYLRRVLEALGGLFHDQRIAAAICPAFLGLLPSAGGAVLSAPMVDEVTFGRDVTPEQKSVVNYWYRHIWEYSFPLYPGLILAARVVEIPIGRLIGRLCPFTLLAMILGIPVAFHAWPREDPRPPEPCDRRRALLKLAGGMAPVAAVIAAVIIGGGLPIYLPVLIVVGILLVLHHASLRELLLLVREAFSWRTVLLVVGIMSFRGSLEATGLVGSLPAFFTGLGLAPAVIVILISLTLGLLLGLGQGFAGTGFPLLLGVRGHGAGSAPGLVCLAYVAGFTGVMLSPLHFCLVLTVQYFRADLGRVWLRVAPAMALILLLAIPYCLWFLR